MGSWPQPPGLGWAASTLILGGRGTRARKTPSLTPSWAGGRPFPPPPVYLLFNSACHSSDVAAAVGWMPIPDPGERLVAEVLLHPHLWEALTPTQRSPCWELPAAAPLRPDSTPPWPRPCPLAPAEPVPAPSVALLPLARSWGCRGPLARFLASPALVRGPQPPLGEDSSLTLSGSPDPMGPFAPCVPPAPLTSSPPPPISTWSLPARGPSVNEPAAESVETTQGEGPPGGSSRPVGHVETCPRVSSPPLGQILGCLQSQGPRPLMTGHGAPGR